MLADYATAENGKVTIVGGGITRIHLEAVTRGIPSLAVLARVSFSDRDDYLKSGGAPITLGITKPDGGADEFGPFSTIGVDIDTLIPGEEIWANMIALFTPFMFPEPGVWSFYVSAEGCEPAGIKVPVLYADMPDS